MQSRRPARRYGQQWHQPYAKEYEDKANISKPELIAAMESFAANHQCQLDTHEKLEAAPEESIEHHKSEIAEKAVPVDVTKDQHH